MMAQLFVGKLFETSDEAITFVTEFCKNNYHPIRRKHNTSAFNYNKKLTEKNKLPESVKYLQMQWECKHFGEFKSRGNDIKKMQRVLSRGCKFQIVITYNRNLQKFIVTKANLEHHNHEISAKVYAMYPDHRKPNAERQAEVDAMLKMNVKPKLIANILHSEGSPVLMKDLYNRKRKLIETEGPIESDGPIELLDDSLTSILSQPGIIYQMISGSDNMFDVLFFQTTKQQKIFSDYGEVVQIDATHKSYNLHYFLYTLLVEDKNGLGQPIAFGILEKPDQAHIDQFLEFFMEQNDITGIQCFAIDKDQAEINSIEKIFPDIPFSIYYFNVLKAVNKYLSNSEESINKKSCLKQFHLILKSKTSEEFDERVRAIKLLSEKFYEYFVQNWIPFKQNITNFNKSDVMHLENSSNCRYKSFHNLLKGVLASAQLPLNKFIKRLLKIVDFMNVELLHKEFDMNAKMIDAQPNAVDYYNHFTEYAAGLISKEMKRMNTKKYSIYSVKNNQWNVTNEKTSFMVDGIKCSCGMPTQMGLPCQHLLAIWNDNGEPLFQPNSVSARWKRETVANYSNALSKVTPSYEDEDEATSEVSEDSDNASDLSQPNDYLSQENFNPSAFSDCPSDSSHKSEIFTPTNSKKPKPSKIRFATSTSSGIVPKVKLEKSNGVNVQRLNDTMANLKDLAIIIADQPSSNFYLMMAAIEKFKTLVTSYDPNRINLGLQDLIDKI